MTVTNFFWDEFSDNLLMETDENNVPTVVYTHRPERFGQLISQKRGGVTSYYHYDGEHSTRLLTDDNQTITDTYIYSAFGELVARTGTTTNPFGYKGAVGYYTNSATNDIYVRARTYQPVTGRWLSMDPLGFVDGPNLYRAYFVPNRLDPGGLSWTSGFTVPTAFVKNIICCKFRDSRGNDRQIEQWTRDNESPECRCKRYTDYWSDWDVEFTGASLGPCEPCEGKLNNEAEKKVYELCVLICKSIPVKDPSDLCGRCERLSGLAKFICESYCHLPSGKDIACDSLCCSGRLPDGVPGDECFSVIFNVDGTRKPNNAAHVACTDCCDEKYSGPGEEWQKGFCKKRCEIFTGPDI